MTGKRANNMLLKLEQPMSLSYELLRVYSVYGFSLAYPLSIGGCYLTLKKLLQAVCKIAFTTPNIFLMIRILQLSTL